MALTIATPHWLTSWLFLHAVKRRVRRRPMLASFASNCDLLKDAKSLHAEGRHLAAAFTARVEIERLLTIAGQRYADFGPYWRGVQETARWLHRHGAFKSRICDRVLAANDIGNAAAHGRPVTADQVAKMFPVIESLRSTVRAKGGAA